MKTKVLPSGLTINIEHITHTRPVKWCFWPSPDVEKVYRSGLDVFFVGGSKVRVEQPDADALHYLLIQAA